MRALAEKVATQEPSSSRRFGAAGKSARNTENITASFTPALLQMKPLCACDGGCPRCASTIQPKLKIGAPNDKYEKEADRIAEQVMRMPEQPVRQTSISRSSSGSLNDGSSPLPQAARAHFEPRFGHDFSNVRIRTDTQANRMAQAINAKAFTYGSSIVFGPSRFSPETAEGKKLIAHELSHVVQQNRMSDSSLNPVVRRYVDIDEPLDGSVPLPAGIPEVPVAESDEETPGEKEKGPGPSEGAVKAVKEAQSLAAQTDPAIWFDSWGNDLRDNNLNGKIDDRTEKGLADGTHYKGTHDAMICKKPSQTTDVCPKSTQSKIKVSYKVCIDIPIEAYKAAGVSISKSRWIPTFFRQLKKMADWQVWKSPKKPGKYLPGDIVAAANPKHQHAGIVSSGALWDNVINLPGPTAARKFMIFRPSGTNDIVTVPRSLFEAYLGIDWVARPKK